MAKQKQTVTESRMYQLSPNFPVLVLSGNNWRISDQPSERLHFHNCMEIGICHEGSGVLHVRGQDITFHENNITIIPMNVAHTTYSTKGTESRWSYIFINTEDLFSQTSFVNYGMNDISALLEIRDFYMYDLEFHPQLVSLVFHCLEELVKKQPFYQMDFRALALQLFIEIHRIRTDESAEPAITDSNSYDMAITPALEYMREQYMNYFTIETLAELCGFSPTHFRRIFHQSMSCSPLEYLNTLRITKACDLLQSSNQSILEISEAVGFRSISSFNRLFVRAVGISPREFRKNLPKDETLNSRIVQYSGWMEPEQT